MSVGEGASGTRKIRLGIIGIGLIAQAVHLQNLGTLREYFEVVHLCDISETLVRQLAGEIGVAVGGREVMGSTDPEDLLRDPEVDAVLILTPGTHAYFARKALEAGKHVLAEKPFAFTAREARELGRLAESTGRVLQVGYMKMYDPIMDRARRELGSLGDIRLVRVTVHHPADDPQFSHQRYVRYADADLSIVRDSIEYEKDRLVEALGSVVEPWRSLYTDVLMGSTVHEMAVLRALFGELPFLVEHAQIGAFTGGERLTEPPQLQVLGTLGAMQFSMSWNWLPDYPEYFEEIAVFGSAGRLSLRFPGPYLRDHRTELTVEGLDDGVRASTRLLSDHKTGFLQELLAFHRAIADGEAVLSTAEGSGWDAEGLLAVIAVLAERNGDPVGGEAAEGLIR